MRRAAAAALLLLAVAAPAAAQDIAFRGWGLRAGVGDDPDQFLFGAHVDMGEFIPNLRFQPHLELGFGDDTDVVALTAPVHYLFPVEEGFTLYGGGGLLLASVDRDDPRFGEEDSEVEIAPVAVGGLQWEAWEGDLFFELAASGGDAHDLKLVLGWTF